MIQKKERVMVFTHYDLDGVVCYLETLWAFPNAKISVQDTTPKHFRQDFYKWSKKHSLKDYDRVFILDLDVCDSKDLIDKPNVYIVDHHLSHVDCKYDQAKAYIIEYTSASKLFYIYLQKAYNINFDKAKQTLIALADDYDSYTLKSQTSLHLNVVFWDTRNSFYQFANNFKNGFTSFSDQQKNIIRLFDKRLNKMKENMVVYANKLKLDKNEYYVCATFADDMINEVAQLLVDDYKADIAIIVNLKSQRVSFRKRNNALDIDLSQLSKSLCNGAGHKNAAGGDITDKFLKFTKLLQEL